MYRWIIAAALVVGLPSIIAIYLRRRQKQAKAQRVTIEAFATKLVNAAKLREPYRDAVKAYIETMYAQKRKVALHQRHPSFVLLHMAKHPCVRKHIHNTMKTCDEELERALKESIMTYDTLLTGKVSYYANLLMEGFDAFNMQEVVIDRKGRLTSLRGTRFNYCIPIDKQSSFYPPNYTRLFNLEKT
jgi:hypothetical protein